jgi:hypothetical protein
MGVFLFCYAVGWLVSLFVFRSRAGTGVWRSLPLSMVLVSLPWAVATTVKAAVWPAVLIYWLAIGRPDSPWELGRSRPGGTLRIRRIEVVRPAEVRRLPADIVSRMRTFGRFDFDTLNYQGDAGKIWEGIVAPLVPVAQADPAGFLRDLADAVVPAGDWAVYGGAHLVKEVLSGDQEDPSYDRMMAASLDFLRGRGVPRSRLNGYEWRFWQKTRGRTEAWLEPGPAGTPVSDRAPGG